jgi:hypothetical protein
MSHKQNKFNSVSAQADQQLARCRQLQQLSPLPDQETASFAMLMMLHGAGWPNHELWEQWQQQHEPGEVTMMVHLKVGRLQRCLCKHALLVRTVGLTFHVPV